MKHYSGSCHCGRNAFEVLADIDHARKCNCSICSMRGALNFRVLPQQLKLLTPIDDLSVYQWGSFSAKDYFCPNCGVLVFRKPSDLTPAELKLGKQPFSGWAVNLRCLKDIDLSALKLIEIDGASL
ncbi:GFA family protein [Alginatibacterium sediminis]|uniref:GFA family protein n=1 Tax=Alginatibacterium sediminis TaxID=2164068 RepID=A0A420E8L5_9ALTE|nr:GFA family protein [Alginatibacterium sediminis]RKF15693.1 GFA family protein [Alginatibacterium sediminis]